MTKALLALFALGGVVSVIKGLSPAIINGADFYWFLTYEYGFTRRALIGTLFHSMAGRVPFEQVEHVVVIIHVAACLAIIVVLYALFVRAVEREGDGTVALAFLLLMCSPLLPSLAHIVGYLDVYIILIAVVALWLVMAERHTAAALLASVGPLVHESFVFLWSSVAILLIWSAITTKRYVAPKLLAAALPILSAAALVGFHNPAAATQSIQAMPLPEEVRDNAIIQMGFTLRASFDHMRRYEYPGHFRNLTIAAAYFLLPSAALLWVAGVTHWRRWAPRPKTTLFVAAAATLSPVAIIALAWDLSRFLVWSNVAAAMVLIAAGSPAVLASSDAHHE